MLRKALCSGAVSLLVLNQMVVAQVSEQSITSEAIAHALADIGTSENEKENADSENVQEPVTDHIDVAKINSSIEKSGLDTDQLEETLAALSKTCAEISTQINRVNDAVVNLKRSARIQSDRTKAHIAQLTTQVHSLEESVKREHAAKVALEKQLADATPARADLDEQPQVAATVVTMQATETVTSSPINVQN